MPAIDRTVTGTVVAEALVQAPTSCVVTVSVWGPSASSPAGRKSTVLAVEVVVETETEPDDTLKRNVDGVSPA